MDGFFTLTSTGAIENEAPYVYWYPEDETAILDGEFTAAQLRAIADHMEGGFGG
jgi:hypothetical protein